MKIVSFSIARKGSKRVPLKNLRILNGKPMMYYALEAARDSKLIDDAYLNTDSDEFGKIGEALGLKFYKRDVRLAEDHVILDQITYDFIQHIDTDIVGMVNTVCPMTTSEDVDLALEHYLKSGADTLISVKEERLHSFVQGEAINFDATKKIPMTQDLNPVQVVSWNFAFWKTDVFRASYEQHGYGVFAGRVYLYAIPKDKAIKISEESDFQIASALLKGRETATPIEYYSP